VTNTMISTGESMTAAAPDWDGQLAGLLSELSSVQGDLLTVLADKRRVILQGDAPAMDSLASRETEIMSRLEACHQRRGALLASAQASGVPATTLRDLARRTASGSNSKAERDLTSASQNFRKLQSESLSNWVLAQRSLLHVSQLLEIIATGGRIQPTYEKDASTHSRGNLVDSEA
jgi:flagellar biosynthesis/type III secretory pathway chaperone